VLAEFFGQQKIPLKVLWRPSSRLDVEPTGIFREVWQFPLRRLAAEYGISDVGLAKV